MHEVKRTTSHEEHAASVQPASNISISSREAKDTMTIDTLDPLAAYSHIHVNKLLRKASCTHVMRPRVI